MLMATYTKKKKKNKDSIVHAACCVISMLQEGNPQSYCRPTTVHCPWAGGGDETTRNKTS